MGPFSHLVFQFVLDELNKVSGISTCDDGDGTFLSIKRISRHIKFADELRAVHPGDRDWIVNPVEGIAILNLAARRSLKFSATLDNRKRFIIIQ